MRLPNAFRLQCWTAGPGSLFFFPLDGVNRREDTIVAIHRTVKKRGVPHASGLRVRVYILPSQSIWSADNNWEQRHPKPHTSNRCVGHPNHLFTWCPDHLPRHPVAARSGQSGFSKDLSYSVLLTLRGLPIL